MCSTPLPDRETVMAVVARHRAALAELVALPLDALEFADHVVVLEAVETARC